jgi:hypothetical protein
MPADGCSIDFHCRIGSLIYANRDEVEPTAQLNISIMST